MLDNGFETPALIELAGIGKPYNQFELHRLTNKVFNELGLDVSDRETVIKSYALYVINLVTNEKSGTLEGLEKLKDLCVELDYDKKLYPFYLLFFAKLDLIDSENQWYFEGADRNNIDSIILHEFDIYKKNNHSE